MKMNLIMALVLSIPVVGANDETSTGQFAVLKPKKSCEVVVPAGNNHNKVYFSEDCQTAYVLPSLKMVKTVIHPFRTADKGICLRYDMVVDSINKMQKTDLVVLESYNSSIEALSLKIKSEDNNEVRKILQNDLVSVTNQRDEYQQKSEARDKKALKRFSESNALRAKISLSSDIMSEVAQFRAANQNLDNVNKLYPIRFVPVEISSSVLAISKKDLASDAANTTVLKVDFPGVRVASSDASYPSDATLLKMNGAMSGIVDLNAITYCEAASRSTSIADADTDNESDLKQIFDAAVQMNLDYKVKVQTGVKLFMKSSLKTIDLLERVQNTVTNTLYSRNEFLGVVVEGKVLNDLEIRIDDKGDKIDLTKFIFGNVDDEENENGPMSNLIQSFISKYFNAVESRLEKLGVYNKMDFAKAKEVAAKTSTEIARYESVCSTSRSWFKKTQSCSLQPVYVQINHDGISNILRSTVDNVDLGSTVNFEFDQTIELDHTSKFDI